MKKLTAISLLTLFLLNIIGYRIVFYYAQQQSDKQLETSFDNNLYNETELVTIKVPLFLPYQTDQAEFQRVDGEISFKGKIYKYVKRRIAEGNLIILCLPDYDKMRLKKQKEDFYKDVNLLVQNTGSKKQQNSESFKNIVSEYDKFENVYLASVLEEQLSHSFYQQEASLAAMPHSALEQPPERA